MSQQPTLRSSLCKNEIEAIWSQYQDGDLTAERAPT
jgi:hypothetical protein